MKPLTRRKLLIATLYSAVLPAPRILAAATTTSHVNKDSGNTMSALVDMILPADSRSPSASQLKVDSALWQLAEDDAQLKKLFLRGCNWLDKESRGNFASLAPQYKQQLLGWMDESASSASLPAVFFKRIRYQAVGLYYATEQARTDLGITQTPQPLGYSEITLRRRAADV